MTESAPLRGSRRTTFTRDLLQIESLIQAYRAQDSAPDLTVLRFANIVGPTADTPMTRLLKLPAPPVLLGFDPLLQFVHEDDVVAALAHALDLGASGVYNVAAADPMPLARAMRLANRWPLPIFHPLAYRATRWLRGPAAAPSRWTPMDWDYLRYPLTVDLNKMREEMGFSPAHTATEAIQAFANRPGITSAGLSGEELAYDEQRLRDTLEQRQEAKKRTNEDNTNNAAGDRA